MMRADIQGPGAPAPRPVFWRYLSDWPRRVSRVASHVFMHQSTAATGKGEITPPQKEGSMNEQLAIIKAQLEEMFADEDLPDEVAPGLSLSDLKEAIGELYLEEFDEFHRAMSQGKDDEQQEALRVFVEAVAEKIALMMCLFVRTDPQAIAVLDADEVTAMMQSFFASGEATLRFTIQR